MTKPTTTYQIYNSTTNILTVHTSDEPTSDVYFEGEPKNYDGTATEPAAPTSQYVETQADYHAHLAPPTPFTENIVS